MVVLGINGGVRLGYQDISAALLVDGKIVAAVEEERLNRIKHSPGQLPYLSIKEVLKIARLNFEDIDVVATHGSTWGTEFPARLKEYLKFTFGSCPEVKNYHHHDCHAASAYYASGFDKAMILTADSSGDGVSLQLAVGELGHIKVLKRIARPDSLGIFYSMITQFCGFTRDSDEYKLMGLSSFGDRTKFDFSHVIAYKNGELSINRNYIPSIEAGQPQPTRQEKLFTAAFEKAYGQHRYAGTELPAFYKDIAASAQQHLEDIMVQLVSDFQQQTGINKICLAGGVALNCAANQKLANLATIEDIYVQPASSDAGISIGAAYLSAAEKGAHCKPMENAFLGSEYSNDEIKATLQKLNLKFSETSTPADDAAALIAAGKVIGWFNGRMEVGPRALGNRSILANPALPGVQSLVNQKIKFREGFRPFCPSILQSEMPNYFTGKPAAAPYMTINYKAAEQKKESINGVVHVDGTARIQTVNAQQSPVYYQLISAFKKLTGLPVVLNTSFNRSNEPIVSNPVDAVSAFYGSGLDNLIIGNYVITKN